MPLRTRITADFERWCTLLASLLLVSIVAQLLLVASHEFGDLSFHESHAAPTRTHPRTQRLFKRKSALSPLFSIFRKSSKMAAPAATAASPLLTVVDQPDIREEHRILADRILRILPAACRDNLRNFYVRYDNPKERGLGGKTTIMIDGNVPDEEFAQLLAHECGHVIHANLTGSPLAKESAYKDGKQVFHEDATIVSFFAIAWKNELQRKDATQPKDFLSGYGQADAFEDFAETLVTYVFHRNYFQKRAEKSPILAAKLVWMEKHLPLNETMESTYDSAAIPWDMTKAGYQWK